MNQRSNTVTVNIDNKPYRVKKGSSILHAAEQNGIYIPTLCNHKDLSPHGGCRMCIVEVEGIRNFPTACTTPVTEGMVIRTHTTQIQAMRKEIIQLFMSEHPSSCLICDEKEECNLYSITISKAGVTTGCRYCPNNGQCEFQDVVEYLEVKEINYPIFYRNLRVEKEDPFYDRDYNLCILCGRCIRMCQEVRLANVLAFKERGRNTVIGPAYARTHFDSGCEFCGACVSVCPTGTLSEKARKWDGKTDREQITTCSFCGVGCQLRLLIKDDRIIGSLPVDDPLINHGQLCVKGRFCITEMVNGYKRLKKPYKSVNGTDVEIPWKEAIEIATQHLSDCPPDQFGMLISPNCFNEDLYVAQKFARIVMGSHHIDTSARLFYGPGFNSYVNLMKRAIPLAEIKKAEIILCIGLDTRFGRSVVGVELRRALQKGAKIITINPRDHNLTLTAEKWIKPLPGEEITILSTLVELTGRQKSKNLKTGFKGANKDLEIELTETAELLKKASDIAILVGTEFIQYCENQRIFEAIEKLASNTNAGILPLPSQNNLVGSLQMGSYSELLPGGKSSQNKTRLNQLKKLWGANISGDSPLWNSTELFSKLKLKVLYLIGENSPDKSNTPADFIIAQNIYPPMDSAQANLILPSAAFTEANGTFINGEGRIQRVNKAVEPPSEALPDWKILCLIAQKMGFEGFSYKSSAEIHREISALVPEFGNFKNPKRQAKPLKFEADFNSFEPKTKAKKPNKQYPFLLCTSNIEHSYRGIPLTVWVKGAKKIFPERTLEISPEDAKKLRIEEGEKITVTSNWFEKVWPVRIAPELNGGILHITLPQAEIMGYNPHPVKIRKKNV
jgi:formate dehydrogenase alpha subunit